MDRIRSCSWQLSMAHSWRSHNTTHVLHVRSSSKLHVAAATCLYVHCCDALFTWLYCRSLHSQVMLFSPVFRWFKTMYCVVRYYGPTTNSRWHCCASQQHDYRLLLKTINHHFLFTDSLLNNLIIIHFSWMF